MRTLTITGGTLFHLAASELGDATQWIRIAQLNNLSDANIGGLMTLQIPDPDPKAGGGIAQQ